MKRPNSSGISVWRAMAAVVLLLLLIVPTAAAQSVDTEAAAAAPGLSPGQHVDYKQRVPINIVFIGYEQGDFKLKDLKDTLPAAYSPIVRYPPFYGFPSRDMGLDFTFAYNYKWAGNRFENDFFGYLAATGEHGPMSDFQALYNDMASNVLDVTDPVLYVDAPSVENWLMTNAGRLGIDTQQGYTIFFINWYGRPDFQFHAYTRVGDPDPDTGFDFGAEFGSRKIIAWGGSHGRAWFHDLSAGPEAWTDNWAVDFPDLDGNGVEDYRMPAIWEYTDGGYRDPAALGMDLGLITRYVAINLLFTTSPLYDPLASTPKPGGHKVNNVEMFELDGGRRAVGTRWYDEALTQQYLAELQPYFEWESNTDLHRRPDIGARWAMRIFTGLNVRPGCWEAFGVSFAQLFCHFDENFADYVSGFHPNDYVVPTFAFHSTARRMGEQFGLLGFADDNWADGTPTYVYVFGAQEYRDGGFGFTSTVVHEAGHHLGMSHPHDGYDSELDVDYGPEDDFYFSWAGDESESVMQYIALSNRFGQFDRDNMNRYQFAGYLNWANSILAGIAAHPDASAVQWQLDAADALASSAQKAFYAWDYDTAAANAHEAWELVASAADQLGVSTAPDMFAQLAVPTSRPVKEGDPIRYPNQ